MTEGNGTQHELGELAANVRNLIATVQGFVDKQDREWDCHRKYHDENEPRWGILAWMRQHPVKSSTFSVVGTAIFAWLHPVRFKELLEFAKANWYRIF